MLTVQPKLPYQRVLLAPNGTCIFLCGSPCVQALGLLYAEMHFVPLIDYLPVLIDFKSYFEVPFMIIINFVGDIRPYFVV